MKTVVVGLFDQIEDAERVLAQLTEAPLDLESIQVLHAETETQRRLSEQAGLPPRKAMRSGLIVGGLLGALLGFVAGWSGPEGGQALLAGPGPLLTLAGGALLGALAGGLGGAFAETSRIPKGHAEAALSAVAGGATMISVQTENLPTARAISDLFRAGGSRVLADTPAGDTLAAATLQGAETTLPPSSGSAGDDPSGADIPDSHAAFAPPWRREPGAEGVRPESRAPSDNATDSLMLFPDASTASPPQAAETASPESQADDDDAQSQPMTPGTVRHGETVTSVDRTTRDMAPTRLPTQSETAADKGEMETVASAAQGLDAMGFPKRIVKALGDAGIEDSVSLQRLVSEGQAGLLSLPGIGPRAAEEITRHFEDPITEPPSSTRDEGSVAADSAQRKGPAPRPRAMPPKPSREQRRVESAAGDLLREIFPDPSNSD